MPLPHKFVCDFLSMFSYRTRGVSFHKKVFWVLLMFEKESSSHTSIFKRNKTREVEFLISRTQNKRNIFRNHCGNIKPYPILTLKTIRNHYSFPLGMPNMACEGEIPIQCFKQSHRLWCKCIVSLKEVHYNACLWSWEEKW